ncbi:hypothetical protein JR316_0009507 [Psilocybe cubensis]|uniref:Uncharacterized protein n=2 Tax=Psilocybe cubensis TaxID=181762 RepID=A0ACB8GNK3_PSICU|nr:hypothetical protein JR316_0009507 [Psilocybe cubensis]KAH9477303.1 hypothetical protein JR316_0009507 [Psilocybe cubensis]
MPSPSSSIKSHPRPKVVAAKAEGLKSQPVVASRPVRARKSQINGPLQSIDTSLSAHPRTDPINALTILLKLLTSLPTRIGGCQFKLTPAEHALSLHLVSILDPFVYHGVRALSPNINLTGTADNSTIVSSPGLGLIQQPTEIIDAILAHVDSRKDLISIGLGCKRLHDIVFPRHFEYRVIRCKVSSIGVWNHLITHSSLARNVRKLEIIDERTPVPAFNAAHPGLHRPSSMLIPRTMMRSSPTSTTLGGGTDLESTDDELHMHTKQERYLSAALLRMTGLKEFKWSCNHSPISIARVWPALMMRAEHLNSVEICDNLVFGPRNGHWAVVDDDSEEDSSGNEEEEDSGRLSTLIKHRPTLEAMESVVFRSTPHSYGASKLPELTRISTMLYQCSNLKNIEIGYITPRSASGSTQAHALIANNTTAPQRARPLADDFLVNSVIDRQPKFAHLTHMTLTNLRCTSPVAPSAFLAAHTMLEVLHLDLVIQTSGNGTNPLQLPPGSLPHLREIKASRDVINSILQCPTVDIKHRPLEVIKGFKLSGHSASSSSVSVDAAFLQNLRTAAGSGIRRVEMLGWHDIDEVKRLVACVPGVQHLDVGRRIGGSGERNGGVVEKNMLEWTDLMTTLPELVSMHGVRFFYEVSSSGSGSAGGGGNANIPGVSGASVSPHHVYDPADSTPNSNGPTHLPASIPPLPQINPNISMMERSRLRKNDETASLLAWKCRKLRRVDHWEPSVNSTGDRKVVVLLRDGNTVGDGENKVRWEVRKVKA